MKVERSIRIRNNISTSTKGIKTPDITIEVIEKFVHEIPDEQLVDFEARDEYMRQYSLRKTKEHADDMAKLYPVEKEVK